MLILDIAELWLEDQPNLPVGSIIVSPAASEQVLKMPDKALIMVVDDSLTVRKITARNLSKNGYDVRLAKDGIDALEKLRESLPAVMLVDIEMPRMDGFELISRVREDSRTRHIPIIVITSRSGSRHREKAKILGAEVYLTKPYQPEELLRQISDLIIQKRLH